MTGLRASEIATIVVLIAASAAAAAEPIPASDATGVELFEKRVRPLLAENCYRCHGPERQRSGLMLNSLAAILKGGDRGPVLVPGKPDQSRLIQAVRYTDELRMPPKSKLTEAQILDLVTWVKMGAPGPRDNIPKQTSAQAAEDFDLAERS